MKTLRPATAGGDDGQSVDADGRRVDDDDWRVDAEGRRRVDADGRCVDADGRPVNVLNDILSAMDRQIFILSTGIFRLEWKS